MNCPTELTLALLAGGEISARERSRVEAHVDDCANCSRVVAEISGLRARVAGLASESSLVSCRNVRTAVLERIAEQGAQPQAWWVLLNPRRWAYATAALIAVLGMTLYSRQSSAPGPSIDTVTRAPTRAREFAAVAQAEAARPTAPKPVVLSAREVATRSVSPAQVPLPPSGNPPPVFDATFAETDGEVRLAQLQIPTENPEIEIYWLTD